MQRFAFFVALVAALLCGTHAHGQQRLVVNYSDIEVAPYQMGEGNTVPNPPGAMVELINLMGKELGLEIVLERAPQLRSLGRLQRGEIDAAFMYSYAPDRLRFGRYPLRDGKPDESARLVYQAYVFYRLKGSAFQWDGTTLSGLGDKGVGFNSTFSVGAALADRIWTKLGKLRLDKLVELQRKYEP